jgi:hypothetical protein
MNFLCARRLRFSQMISTPCAVSARTRGGSSRRANSSSESTRTTCAGRMDWRSIDSTEIHTSPTRSGNDVNEAMTSTVSVAGPVGSGRRSRRISNASRSAFLGRLTRYARDSSTSRDSTVCDVDMALTGAV